MIRSLTIGGFKSFGKHQSFDMRARNILIGQNGAGKSNFLQIFRLLSYGYTGDGIQYYVSSQGGANALLHDSAQYTREIELALNFDVPNGIDEYRVRLTYAANETLFFSEERFRFTPKGDLPAQRWTDYKYGHPEPGLRDDANSGNKMAKIVLSLLRDCKLYQFHNTSVVSRMRQKWQTSDSLVLKEDGGNIAPVLYRMAQQYPRHFGRLQDTLSLVFPQFAEFILEPSEENILLRWRERKSDLVFGAHQASDGTLRLMALLTLLMQPSEKLPRVLLLDEPELGLHPAAVQIIAEQLHSVSSVSQVVVATQSAYFLNFFSADDIVVADRLDRGTELRRLSEEELSHWLEEYSLAQLWEKNVLGGKPI